MDNELHVSPISDEHVLILNSFRIVIVMVVGAKDYLQYSIYRKGLHIRDYKSLQEAVDWCKID